MLFKADRLEEADIIIEKALSNLSKNSEHFFQSEIYRLKGVIGWKKDGKADSEIEAYLNEALLCAQQQSAAGLELRAAISLGDYLLSGAEIDKAKSILTNAMSNLTEGKPLDDYQQAMTLWNKIELSTVKDTKTKIVEPA